MRNHRADVRFHHRAECDVFDVFFCTIFLDFKKARPFHPSRVQNAFDFIIDQVFFFSAFRERVGRIRTRGRVHVRKRQECGYFWWRSARQSAVVLVKGHPDVRGNVSKNAKRKKEALAEDDECDALNTKLIN